MRVPAWTLRPGSRVMFDGAQRVIAETYRVGGGVVELLFHDEFGFRASRVDYLAAVEVVA